MTYKKARGVLPHKPGDEPPEQVIRRLRGHEMDGQKISDVAGAGWNEQERDQELKRSDDMADVGSCMMAVAAGDDLPTVLRAAAAWLDDNNLAELYDITVREQAGQWVATVYYEPERENKEY